MRCTLETLHRYFSVTIFLIIAPTSRTASPAWRHIGIKTHFLLFLGPLIVYSSLKNLGLVLQKPSRLLLGRPILCSYPAAQRRDHPQNTVTRDSSAPPLVCSTACTLQYTGTETSVSPPFSSPQVTISYCISPTSSHFPPYKFANISNQKSAFTIVCIKK